MSTLCVITARGGSKGLPGKNIRPLCGKPLIAWSIEHGKACSFVDDVIVSTDCPEIARCAQEWGAEVPFLRPPELASDTAGSIDVLIHALDSLEQTGRTYQNLLLLEPTSPLRRVDALEQAFQKLQSSPEGEAIVGVAQVECTHPAFLSRMDEGGRLSSYSEFSTTRRQDLEPLFFFEGSLYLSLVSTLRRERSFYHSSTLGYEFPRWSALEIDSLEDFLMVEFLMQARQDGRIKT